MPRKRHNRRLPLGRIKLSCSYDTHEITKLLGIHRNTVRQWLKVGLKPIDNRRPRLMHGSELKAFLTARQQSRRTKCEVGEFYCFKCRAAQRPWGDTADARIHSGKIVKLTALCPVYGIPMNRMVRRADLPKFASLLEIKPVGPERLSDCVDASVNCDSGKSASHVQTES